MSKLNDIDQRLIRELAKDGRISWVQLAEKVNLSASAAQRRVEALVRSGIIKKFSVELDAEKLGQTITAVISVNVERQKTGVAEKFRNKIVSYPEVENFVKLSGSVDYQFVVRAADIKALSHFIDNKLLVLDGVIDANSAIVLEEFHGSASRV
jgi:DNA-binding Lrp family transcriptional regulator